jgi:hypothetical protein
MVRLAGVGLLALVFPMVSMQSGPAKVRVGDGPSYTADGQLKFPEKYREWVFLSSGLDMSYDPKPMDMGSSTFNNVFVNPEAYRAYQQTGHWPEGTEIVLENRAADKGTRSASLNKAGKTQSTQMTGLEVHLLDSARLAPKHENDGWGFYSFSNPVSAEVIPRAANCYSCHEQHAAVDTTFVQFYPTLLDAAEKHRTASASFLKEMQGK